ncbi:MAG: hypothetical protein K0R63_82 [Rickettsiales bacterium]|jgi:hypothetical protein|nr:hypothetical protein [Rickettsiales bacterium]
MAKETFLKALDNDQISEALEILNQADNKTISALLEKESGIDCYTFQEAAQTGSLTLVERFWNKMSKPQQQAALEAQTFNAYNCGPLTRATAYNHLPVMQFLWDKMSESQQKSFLTTSARTILCYGMQTATTTEFLLNKMSKEEQKFAIELGGYTAIQQASVEGQHGTVKLLLTYAISLGDINVNAMLNSLSPVKKQLAFGTTNNAEIIQGNGRNRGEGIYTRMEADANSTYWRDKTREQSSCCIS